MIYYIGYYSLNNTKKRICAQSANGVYLYILSAIRSVVPGSENLVALNCAQAQGGFYTPKEKREEGGIIYVQRPSFFGNRLIRKFDFFFFKKWFKKYLISHLKKDDLLVVYHSLTYMALINEVIKRVGCKCLINIEEFYGDVSETPNNKIRKKEELFFSQCSGSIVCANTLLSEKSICGRPYAIVYGDYRNSPTLPKKKDGTIRLVYSGTLSALKGARQAIDSLDFLPSIFELHILSVEDPGKLKNYVDTKPTRNRIFFDGAKFGDDFSKYISSFDIGMAPQPTTGKLNSTSFPSKIIVYLKADLKVVATPSKAIMHSSLKNDLFISENDTPVSIADAVKKAAAEKRSGLEVVRLLDTEFRCSLKRLLNEIR